MKTIAYLITSLNGMIATQDDSTPWSDTSWKNYLELVNEIGCLLVGYRTYQIMKREGDFESFAKPPVTVVITQNPDLPKGVQSAKSVAEAVELVKQQGFERALVGGGSQTVTTFIQEGLLNELWLDIEPKLIGHGINLIKDVNLDKDLELMEVKQLDEDIVHVKYRMVQRG